MVFGWGKKKEKEIPKEIPQQKEVSLSEVEKITNELLDLRKTQTLAEIKSLRNQTFPLLKELSSIIRNLEKDDLKVDDIDKHIRIIVVRGKKQVIDVIKKESADLPEVHSIDDLTNLNNILNQKLKKIGDVLGRQTRVIHIFAKKYAEKLKEILAEMNSNNTEIQNLINNYQDSTNSSKEIIVLLETIEKLKEGKNTKKIRINELKNSMTLIENKILDLQNAIEEIKSEKKFKDYLELKQNLSTFMETKNKIKNQIDAQFTKISRPLGRYEYSSSLDKEQKILLSQLVNEPPSALTSRNLDSIITILENVRKGIQSGSISVKDEEKSLHHLTETEELLEPFIKKINGFEEKRKEMENQISSFDFKNLTTSENELIILQNQKNDYDNKISIFEKEIEENTKKIPQIILEIEQKLKKFSNTSYTIRPNDPN